MLEEASGSEVGEDIVRLVASILADRRLYRMVDAQPMLTKAISGTWGRLSGLERVAVLGAIRDAIPDAKWYENGYVASGVLRAIPVSDLPADLKTLLDTADSKGWHRENAGDERPEPPDYESPAWSIEGLSVEANAAWDEFRKQPIDRFLELDQPAQSKILAATRTALGSLPPLSSLKKDLWPLSTISRAVAVLTKPEVDQHLTADEARRIFDWALSSARGVDTNEANANQLPVPVSDHMDSGRDFVGGVWDGASPMRRCDLHALRAHEGTLTGQYLSEVERVMANLSPASARHVFAYTHPRWWFVSGDRGKAALVKLLLEIRDVGALRWALRTSFYLDEERLRSVLDRWLLRKDAPTGEQKDRSAFGRDIGHALGLQAMHRHKGNHPWFWNYAVAVLQDPPGDGLLAEPVVFGEFALGVIFGAKTADVPKDAHATAIDFGYLTALAWGARRRRLIGANIVDDERPLIFVLSPFGDAVFASKQQRLWDELSPLFVEVMRCGPLLDVSDLLFGLKRELVDALGAARMVALLDALHVRVEEAGTDRKHDGGRIESWPRLLRDGCQLLEIVGTHPSSSPAERRRCYEILLRSLAELGHCMGSSVLGTGVRVRGDPVVRISG